MKKSILGALWVTAAMLAAAGCKDRTPPPTPAPAVKVEGESPFSFDLAPRDEERERFFGQVMVKDLERRGFFSFLEEFEKEMPKIAEVAIEGIEASVAEAVAKAEAEAKAKAAAEEAAKRKRIRGRDR